MEIQTDIEFLQCKENAVTELAAAVDQCIDGNPKFFRDCVQSTHEAYTNKLIVCTQNWLAKVKECRDSCLRRFSNSIEM